MQIRFPFHLKPWHRSKLRSTKKDPMKKKKGLLLFNNFGNGSGIALFHVTQNPFGFFQPILTKLETKKMTNSFLSGSRDFKCKNKN
ncbi:hypothetical protein HN51_040432, partial [Arachis hypogaea]